MVAGSFPPTLIRFHKTTKAQAFACAFCSFQTEFLGRFFPEPGTHQRFGLDLSLAYFQLPEDRLQPDEELMPLALHGAQTVLVHFTEKAYRWGGGDQRVDILAADGSAI